MCYRICGVFFIVSNSLFKIGLWVISGEFIECYVLKVLNDIRESVVWNYIIDYVFIIVYKVVVIKYIYIMN